MEFLVRDARFDFMAMVAVTAIILWFLYKLIKTLVDQGNMGSRKTKVL